MAGKKIPMNDRIRNAFLRHPGISMSKVRYDYVREATTEQIKAVYDEMLGSGQIDERSGVARPRPVKTAMKAISRDELRLRHNPYFKIRKELNEIPKGAVYEEQSFKMKLQGCGVTSAQYNSEMKNSEFAKHRAKAMTGNVFYVGHQKDIDENKREGNLI